nr:hypothetical protein [Pseudomonas chlororaphis]
MTKPFDMALFLNGVLRGSHATRQRHIKQAEAMQKAIQKRWKLDSPWAWQLKHMRWFLNHHLCTHAPSTRYYYQLTADLISRRLDT